MYKGKIKRKRRGKKKDSPSSLSPGSLGQCPPVSWTRHSADIPYKNPLSSYVFQRIVQILDRIESNWLAQQNWTAQSESAYECEVQENWTRWVEWNGFLAERSERAKVYNAEVDKCREYSSAAAAVQVNGVFGLSVFFFSFSFVRVIFFFSYSLCSADSFPFKVGWCCWLVVL